MTQTNMLAIKACLSPSRLRERAGGEGIQRKSFFVLFMHPRLFGNGNLEEILIWISSP